MTTIETRQGETWDIIAKRLYGNEMYHDILINANPLHRKIAIFPAGIVLHVPEINSASQEYESSLPPWKQPSAVGLIKGDKGDKGERGEKGDRGEKGEKGEKGEPGEYIQPTSIPDSTSTAATIDELAENVRYVYMQPLTSLTIESVPDSAKETEIQFTAGTGITVSLPADVGIMPDGGVTFAEGKGYIINFRNKLAVIASYTPGVV